MYLNQTRFSFSRYPFLAQPIEREMEISGHLEVMLYGVSLAFVYPDNYDATTPGLVYSKAIQPAKFYISKDDQPHMPPSPDV